jgi:hypothetical protein
MAGSRGQIRGRCRAVEGLGKAVEEGFSQAIENTINNLLSIQYKIYINYKMMVADRFLV